MALMERNTTCTIILSLKVQIVSCRIKYKREAVKTSLINLLILSILPNSRQIFSYERI